MPMRHFQGLRFNLNYAHLNILHFPGWGLAKELRQSLVFFLILIKSSDFS